MNRLLKHVDSIQLDGNGRTPVVLVGGGQFSSSMRGHRAAGQKEIVQFLATKFPVFFIDEYNTSKCCPKCFKTMNVVPGTQYRHWTCSNPECRSKGHSEPFLVNKDKSAAINMFLCMLATLMSGKRPKQFRRPTKKKTGVGDSGDDETDDSGGDDSGDDSGGDKSAKKSEKSGDGSKSSGIVLMKRKASGHDLRKCRE